MRSGVLVFAFLALIAARAGAQASVAAPARPTLTDSEQERFLLEAKVVRTKGAPGGATLSTRATLRLDGFEHDAHIQTIDEAKPVVNLRSGLEFDFRDSYKGNVAAYRLDRLVGLGMVPVTVVRDYERKEAAYTWWVDDVLMTEGERRAKEAKSHDTEAWNRQIYIVRMFDQLIYNFDRNLGNILIDSGWRIWMIDHTRAFKVLEKINKPSDLGTRCERNLFAALKRLDRPTLRATMKGVMTTGQIDGLLTRRDLIVKHYEDALAQHGEALVLYDHPSRLTDAVAPR
jgi:hypothetical protein